jgi:YHS domain-containing protein
MQMTRWIVGVMVVALVLVGVVTTMKKVSPVSWGLWGSYVTTSGVAIEGYDPVAYFKAGGPTKGDSGIALDWGGATWYFATAENKEAFAQSPSTYAPQFGGFCAFAVSKGFTADPAPEAWHIQDGKLYLFADDDVRTRWVTAIPDGSLQASRNHWARR